MLRIRLRRTGKTGQAAYRLVVTDQRDRRDGRFVENLGFFNPHADPPAATFDHDSAKSWLEKGAQPSDAVAKIFRREGIIEGGPIKMRSQKSLDAAAAKAAVEEAAAAKVAAEDAAKAAEAAAAEEAPAEEASEEAPAEEASEDAPAEGGE